MPPSQEKHNCPVFKGKKNKNWPIWAYGNMEHVAWTLKSQREHSTVLIVFFIEKKKRTIGKGFAYLTAARAYSLGEAWPGRGPRQAG